MSGQGEWFLEYMKIFLGKTSHSWAMQVLTGQRQVIPGQGELFLGKRGGGGSTAACMFQAACFRLWPLATVTVTVSWPRQCM